MKQKYEYYTISNNTVDLEHGFINEDFRGVWDSYRKEWKNIYDEEGVKFYIFKEEENRMELTCLDPEGNGCKEVITRVE